MRNTCRTLASCIALLSAGCQSHPPNQSVTPITTAAHQTPAPAPAAKLQGFNVVVSLSNKAMQRLAKGKETLIVAGYFSGNPKPDAIKQYISDIGDIDLGRIQAEIAPGAQASFKEIQLEPDALEQSDGQDPDLLINVYSGRKSFPDNLLDCTIYHGRLKPVQGRNIPIQCKLIAE